MATENNYQVKGVFNKFKQAVHYYNVMESKVLQATNTDAWGAPSSLMRSLADGTRESEKLSVIMPALYRRLTVKDTRQWLQVYKAVVLLEYLIKYGDDQVLSFVQSHQEVLVNLQTFEFIDEKGQDKGYNVRVRSKTVEELVKDPEEIKRIREYGRLSQERFIGVGSDDIAASPTEKTKDDTKTDETNQSPAVTKKLPSIDLPLPPVPSAIMKEEDTAKMADEMDNVIFREDFIDPLDEDNHAMVFPANGGKGKAATLSVNDLTDEEDSDGVMNNKKSKKKSKSKSKKKETAETVTDKNQEPKKKSRFSLTSVFSRSKQSAPVASDEPPMDQQATTVASNPSIGPALQDTTTAVTDTSDKNMATNSEEDDGWGDFASPDQGTDLLDDGAKHKEEDLLDLDCDILTTSSARTSVDNNDLVLLDMDMPSYNDHININYNNSYPTHTALSPPPLMMKSNILYNQMQPTSNTFYNQMQPTGNMMNCRYPSSNQPATMMNNSNTPTPLVETPTTPFDFDPLGYASLSTPTSAPQQLTQHWYPWMSANNNTPYQQKQLQQQRPLTVDDLLS